MGAHTDHYLGVSGTATYYLTAAYSDSWAAMACVLPAAALHAVRDPIDRCWNIRGCGERPAQAPMHAIWTERVGSIRAFARPVAVRIMAGRHSACGNRTFQTYTMRASRARTREARRPCSCDRRRPLLATLMTCARSAAPIGAEYLGVSAHCGHFEPVVFGVTRRSLDGLVRFYI